MKFAYALIVFGLSIVMVSFIAHVLTNSAHVPLVSSVVALFFLGAIADEHINICKKIQSCREFHALRHETTTQKKRKFKQKHHNWKSEGF
jgi:hypothetical protein